MIGIEAKRSPTGFPLPDGLRVHFARDDVGTT